MKLRREEVLTFLNAHLLLVVVLAVVNIVLLTRLVLAWSTLHADRPEQIAEYRANMKTLELQTAPLRGLPVKVDASEKQAVAFYEARVPTNYSSISAELHTLEEKEHVHVARLLYVPKPALSGLGEVELDLSLTGEYPSLMRYINGLERDRIFFLINGLTLTGQQGGNVNVRLRLITYIHAADVEHMPVPAAVGAAEADDTKPSADAPANPDDSSAAPSDPGAN